MDRSLQHRALSALQSARRDTGGSGRDLQRTLEHHAQRRSLSDDHSPNMHERNSPEAPVARRGTACFARRFQQGGLAGTADGHRRIALPAHPDLEKDLGSSFQVLAKTTRRRR